MNAPSRSFKLTRSETGAAEVALKLGVSRGFIALVLLMARRETGGALWARIASGRGLVLPDFTFDKQLRQWRLRHLTTSLAEALLRAQLVRHLRDKLAPTSLGMRRPELMGDIAVQQGAVSDLAAFGFGPLAQFLLYAGKRAGWPAASWPAVKEAESHSLDRYWLYHFSYLGNPRAPMAFTGSDPALRTALSAHYGYRRGRQAHQAFAAEVRTARAGGFPY